MGLIDQKRILLLLSILQEPNAKRARKRYVELFELEDLDDQAVHDRFEDLIFDAALLNQPTVELDIDFAIAAFVILKHGVRRPKGGQRKSRHETRRKKVLGRLGRQLKKKYVDTGMSAAQAHLKAAAVVARFGQRRGITFADTTIKREMDSAP